MVVISPYTLRVAVCFCTAALTAADHFRFQRRRPALLISRVVEIGAGGSAPAINDITTNLDEPPEFSPAEAGHPNAERDMSYPNDWVVIAREAYPDLEPIRIARSRDAAYAAAIAQAEALGWTLTLQDPQAGVFEAEDIRVGVAAQRGMCSGMNRGLVTSAENPP